MIEKLLRYPNVPSPYLGESRPVDNTVAKTSFQALLPRSEAPTPPPQLKSVSQHLQLSVQVRTQDSKPKLLPQNDPTHKLASQLSNAVKDYAVNHPLQSKYSDAYLQELLLLHALTRSVRQKPPELLVPSQSALLSYVPLEKTWHKDKSDPKQLKVGGRAFVHFHFAWEDENASDSDDSEGSLGSSARSS